MNAQKEEEEGKERKNEHWVEPFPVHWRNVFNYWAHGTWPPCCMEVKTWQGYHGDVANVTGPEAMGDAETVTPERLLQRLHQKKCLETSETRKSVQNNQKELSATQSHLSTSTPTLQDANTVTSERDFQKVPPEKKEEKQNKTKLLSLLCFKIISDQATFTFRTSSPSRSFLAFRSSVDTRVFRSPSFRVQSSSRRPFSNY